MTQEILAHQVWKMSKDGVWLEVITCSGEVIRIKKCIELDHDKGEVLHGNQVVRNM